MKKARFIGFDAKRLFLNDSGLGNYARALMAALGNHFPEDEYHLYTPSVGTRKDCSRFLTGKPYHLHTPPRGVPGTIWRTAGIIKSMGRHNIDLYHGLSNELPIGIRKTGIPCVVSIHDLIFRYYPEHYSRVDRAIYNGKCKYACENAHRIVAVSETTKRDIIAAYNIPDYKVKVIHHACHEKFYELCSAETIKNVRTKYHLPEEYILYVGTMNERKNLLSLVKAMHLLPTAIEVPLVAVGPVTPYVKTVENFVASKKMSDRVFLRHDIEDEDMPAIYQGATVFCMPSLYEGFALPILEALASGTPVLAGNRSSLPEVGGPGSMYVDPEKPEAIAEGLEKMLDGEGIRLPMSRLGKDYAQRFQGKVVSASLVELYDELLKA
jgi:glycosyltransferase involved in cell wall biosynthesis